MSDAFTPFGTSPRVHGLVEACRKMIQQRADDEDVLRFLRRQACTKTESAGILALAKEVRLSDVKEIVHRSETWKDAVAADEALDEQLGDALKQL